MLERIEWGLLLLLCTSGPLVATGLLLKRLSVASGEVVGGLGGRWDRRWHLGNGNRTGGAGVRDEGDVDPPSSTRAS